MIEFYDDLIDSFDDKKSDSKLDYLGNYNPTLKPIELESIENIKLDDNLLDIYKELSNGFNLGWFSNEEKSIGGNMHFMEMKHVLGSHKDTIYDEQDVQMNDLIEFYKPFDLITETFSCGFLLTPNFVSKSIYCVSAGDPETYDLDIDFAGYMEMAYEAKIFNYWPKVLLDIQSGEESPETIAFKQNMPKIFEDFNWDNFVTKYQSLRLSNKD